MKNEKLSNNDVNVKKNIIALDKNVHGLFKPFVNQKIRIVDQDDYEFYFDVKRYKNGQLFLSQTKDFVNQWNLKEGDILSFKYNSNICSFTVDISKKGISQERKETSNSFPETITIDEKSKTDIISTISQTYQSVVDEYSNTFVRNCYLPTKSAQSSLVINGFTERNLTFNFCHAYLMQNSDAIVWQEIPIIDVNRQHVDSIIIDKKNDLVIYLEAKRLYDITHFEFLLDDLDRIKRYHSNIPLPLNPPAKKIVVLLADLYFNGVCKKKEYKDCYYDKFFSSQEIKSLPEIEKDYPKLQEKIISAKISKVNDIQTINIQGDNKYNIPINGNLDYTIYCGVYFIDGTEKK